MWRAVLLLGLTLIACAPDDAPTTTPGPVTPKDPIVELRRRITSTFGDEQARALSDLLKLGEPATGAVRELLGRPEFRNEVLLALIRTPDRAGPVLEAVTACLADEMMLVRWNATRVLGSLKEKASSATGALATALGDERFEVRIGAAKALGAIGPAAAGAIPSLVAACEAEPLPRNPVGDPRAEALLALAALGPPARPAVGRIIPWATGDESPEMVKAARDSEVLAFPFRVLATRDDPRRSQAAGVIAARTIDPERIPEVMKLLSDGSYDVRSGAANCLAFQGKAAAPFLMQAWRGVMSVEDRMLVLEGLIRIGELPVGGRRFLEIEAVNEQRAWKAFRLLGDLGERARPSVPVLARTLVGMKNLAHRERLIETLGRIGGEPAVVALVGVVRDSAYAERILAIRALEKMGSGAESAVPALRKLAATPPEMNLQLRAAAAIVRIRSGDPAAISRIVSLMDTGDRARRMVALDTLVKLGRLAKPALPHLEKIESGPGNDVFFRAARRAAKQIRALR